MEYRLSENVKAGEMILVGYVWHLIEYVAVDYVLTDSGLVVYFGDKIDGWQAKKN